MAIMTLILPLNVYAFSMPNIEQMLENINTQMPYLWRFVFGLSYISGVFMVFRGIYHLKVYGDPHSMMSGNKDLKPALITLFVGVLFIFLPSTIEVSLTTVFGTNTPMAYPTSTPVDQSFSEIGQTIVYIVQFLGAVAIFRGIVFMHRLGAGQAQQGTFGKAITHFIGGTLCLNIVGAANIMGSTLGINW